MKVINYKQILPVDMDNEVVKNVAGRVLIGREDGYKMLPFVCLVPSKAAEL